MLEHKKWIIRLVMLISVMTLVTIVFASLCVASEGAAAQQDIFSTVSSKFNDIYVKLGAVITALGGVAIAICAIKWIFGTDPQTVRSAKQWLLYIAIGLAIYWLADVIINTVKSIVTTTSAVRAIDCISRFI